MVHRRKRKKAEMYELYRKSKRVPVAWQVWGKHRLDKNWYPVGQQRKYEDDAQKDKIMIKRSLMRKLPPVFKEYKIIQVPASPSEMTQRKLLKGLEKHKTTRGVIESFGGTIAETKWGGAIPFKLLGIG